MPRSWPQTPMQKAARHHSRTDSHSQKNRTRLASEEAYKVFQEARAAWSEVGAVLTSAAHTLAERHDYLQVLSRHYGLPDDTSRWKAHLAKWKTTPLPQLSDCLTSYAKQLKNALKEYEKLPQNQSGLLFNSTPYAGQEDGTGQPYLQVFGLSHKEAQDLVQRLFSAEKSTFGSRHVCEPVTSESRLRSRASHVIESSAHTILEIIVEQIYPILRDIDALQSCGPKVFTSQNKTMPRQARNYDGSQQTMPKLPEEVGNGRQSDRSQRPRDLIFNGRLDYCEQLERQMHKLNQENLVYLKTYAKWGSRQTDLSHDVVLSLLKSLQEWARELSQVKDALEKCLHDPALTQVQMAHLESRYGPTREGIRNSLCQLKLWGEPLEWLWEHRRNFKQPGFTRCAQMVNNSISEVLSKLERGNSDGTL